MQSERDLIKQQVQPEINDFANSQQISVEFVDFRWGIDSFGLDSEEAAERKALKVCKDEIIRCRPFQIVFLGNRYGWIPSENQIKEHAPGMGESRSITDIEIEIGAFSAQSRLSCCFFYFRKPLPFAQMGDKVREMYYDTDQTRIENLKKRIVASGANVFEYDAGWENEKVVLSDVLTKRIVNDVRSAVENEIEALGLNDSSAWLRQMQKSIDFFAVEQSKSASGLEPLTQAVLEKISVEKVFRRSFCGIFIRGSDGAGKSVLLAKLYLDMKKRGDFVIYLPVKELIDTLPGLRASDSSDMLDSLNHDAALKFSMMHQIRNHLAQKGISVPKAEDDYDWESNKGAFWWRMGANNPEGLAKEMKRLFSYINGQIVVIIDDFDALDAYERQSIFPQEEMEFNFELIAAVKPESTAGVELFPAKKRIILDLKPAEMPMRKSILDNLSERFRKELPPEILDKIAIKEGARSPLYIAIVFEFLLSLDSEDFGKINEDGAFNNIYAYITALVDDFPEDISGALALIILKAGKIISPWFIEEVCGIIAASKNGLPEAALAKIMADQWSALDFAWLRKYLNCIFIRRSNAYWDYKYDSFRKIFIKKDSYQKLFAYIDSLTYRKTSFLINDLYEQEYLRLADECGCRVGFQRYFDGKMSTFYDFPETLRQDYSGSHPALIPCTKYFYSKIKKNEYTIFLDMVKTASGDTIELMLSILLSYPGYMDHLDDRIILSKFIEEYIFLLNDEKSSFIEWDSTTLLGIQEVLAEENEKIFFNKGTPFRTLSKRFIEKDKNMRYSEKNMTLVRFVFDMGPEGLSGNVRDAVDTFYISKEILKKSEQRTPNPIIFLTNDWVHPVFNNMEECFEKHRKADVKKAMNKANKIVKKTLSVFKVPAKIIKTIQFADQPVMLSDRPCLISNCIEI